MQILNSIFGFGQIFLFLGWESSAYLCPQKLWAFWFGNRNDPLFILIFGYFLLTRNYRREEVGFWILTQTLNFSLYRKDTEPLYLFLCTHFVTCITLLSGIYPFPAMHLLLFTSDVRNIVIFASFYVFCV